GAGLLAATRRLSAARWPVTVARPGHGLPLALLLLVGALDAIVVLSDPRITPEYPWAARRWVGILIPTATVLAAAQLAWLLPARRRHLAAWVPRAALPFGLALVLL